jgi:signal peptidase II
MRALSLTAIIVFLLDQASKLGVIRLLGLRERGEISVIDPVLNFRWAENRGVNFGLFANSADFMRWVLILVALGISIWVVLWLRRTKASFWPMVAGGMLVGGALGNVVDRIAYGYVADFITMACCGFENPYSFNVADVAIFAGALALVALGGKPTPPKARKTP